MSATVNLEYKLGENWVLDVTCKDSTGAIIDLTGVTVRWRLSLAGSVLLDLSTGSGITIVSAANGECLITVTPMMQAAASIAASFCLHQCRLTLADGSVSDQFDGTFKIKPSLF